MTHPLVPATPSAVPPGAPSPRTPVPAPDPRAFRRLPPGERAEALLRVLVAFPTVSPASNLPLIRWVQGLLEGCGARCRLTWNDAGTKANLLATLGPPGPGGVVLSGHTDVVPAVEPGWTTDPFTLVEAAGRLHGRGTSDMKGFLAAALAVALEVASEVGPEGAPEVATDTASKDPASPAPSATRRATPAPDLASPRELPGGPTPTLAHPLHLALSFDEEVGCLGAPLLIRDMARAGLHPAAVVVGEPTGMRPAVAHKSVNLFRTRVIGVEAHSSQPHLGAGAILAAGRLVELLWRLGEEARAGAESPTDAALQGFEPPWTTVQVGTIEGGTAANILPAACTFSWEYRALPHEDPDALLRAFEAGARDQVLPTLREFAPGAGIETEAVARVPPLLPEEGGVAEALARSLLPGHGEAPGDASPRPVVAYGTEGGQFQGAGYSTVLCGPGSIDRAHRANEYLERSELEAAVAFLQRLLGRLADPRPLP
jgi:acetylornithine deacetylase